MAWVYLDDGFPDHPKVALAGGDAGWLWVCGMAYVKRYATKGMIPKAQVPKLSDRRSPMKLARRLVDVGLWHDEGDHYRVHDYGDWNKPQESRSAAGRKAAQARWAREADANGNAFAREADANGNAFAYAIASESDSDPPSERNADPHASGCPIPIPIPTDDLKGGENSRAAPPQTAPPPGPPEPKCPAHRHLIGSGPPCGQCADHRRAHDTWQQERPTSPLDPTAKAQRQRTENGTQTVREIVAEPADPERIDRVRNLRENALRTPPAEAS